MTILRDIQLAALEAALITEPGRTAYQAGLHVPVSRPERDQQPVLSGQLPAVPAPLTLTLGLLRELERTGRARQEPDRKGARWYPVDRRNEP